MSASGGLALAPLYMVFDVESIGLHGEGFAVGYVVMTRNGVPLEEGLFACNPVKADGDRQDQSWVSANVPQLARTAINPHDVRTAFWDRWRHWGRGGAGAVLVADCGWPVEARFLAQCVDDDRSRNWLGPYPLHELASMLLLLGKDPLAERERLPQELPKHNPLADARQSARLLAEALALGEVSAPR